MNFGSWKGHLMVLKRGNQWKLFWRTCTSPTIGLPYVLRPTSGADTMTYHSNHPPPLRQLLVLFYHTRNTPTSTSPNRTKRYRTNSIFYSHAGDVPPNTTLKEPPPLYIGHHGGLHHLLPHRQHCNVPLPLNRPTIPPQQVHGPLEANETDLMDMSDSSV